MHQSHQKGVSFYTAAWSLIDQPVFQQFNWTPDKKKELQYLVEKMHKEWPIDRNYIVPPSSGKLVKLDPALIINPPIIGIWVCAYCDETRPRLLNDSKLSLRRTEGFTTSYPKIEFKKCF